MERLTKLKGNYVCWNGNQDYSTRDRYAKVLGRLAAYEDTGLTPEEVHRLKAKYEALESDKNVIESSHINAEMNLEAQQQEIKLLNMEIAELRESNQALKDYAENADADKDEQAGCEVCNKGLPCENGCDGFCDICDIPEVWKTIHKTGQYNYCPICGKKLGTVPICNTTKLPCAECNPCCEHRAKS